MIVMNYDSFSCQSASFIYSFSSPERTLGSDASDTRRHYGKFYQNQAIDIVQG